MKLILIVTITSWSGFSQGISKHSIDSFEELAIRMKAVERKRKVIITKGVATYYV